MILKNEPIAQIEVETDYIHHGTDICMVRINITKSVAEKIKKLSSELKASEASSFALSHYDFQLFSTDNLDFHLWGAKEDEDEITYEEVSVKVLSHHPELVVSEQGAYLSIKNENLNWSFNTKNFQLYLLEEVLIGNDLYEPIYESAFYRELE